MTPEVLFFTRKERNWQNSDRPKCLSLPSKTSRHWTVALGTEMALSCQATTRPGTVVISDTLALAPTHGLGWMGENVGTYPKVDMT